MTAHEHIIEAIGRTRVVVRDGCVVEVGDPTIRECPLAQRFAHPVREMTKEEIRANVEERIRSFGMCTADRDLGTTRDFVVFGASEMLSSAMAAGLIDAAVIACEGAGTVIALRPDLVQGIGGRMSGLLSTTPIPALIRRIEDAGGIVPFPDTALLDQYGGVARAREAGYTHVAVTVATASDAVRIREDFPSSVIVGVHTTGISRGDAEQMAAACDILSACASASVREAVTGRVLVQGGISVPVYALTPAGKAILLEKIRVTGQPMLIRGASLPLSGEKGPTPLL
jgi:putative methanogenesis marker protein 8